MNFANNKRRTDKVAEIFIKAKVQTYDTRDLSAVVGMAEFLKPKGYSLEMVAEFLVTEKNLEVIEKVGIKKFIHMAQRAKFPTIQAKKMKYNRNEPCPCGSGTKFKKCCITKI
jgi:uncharacterized protein YchJ